MAPRYRRAPFVALVPVPGRGAAFRTASGLLLLEGEDAALALALWPALAQGGDALALARAAGVEALEAEETLEALAEAGLVATSEDAGFRALAAAKDAGARDVAGERVEVQSEWPSLARAIRDALDGWGLRAGEEGARAAIVAGHPASGRFFERANAEALASGRPTVFVEWRGLGAHVGPTVRARATSCWRCLDLRAWSNAEAPEAHEAERASGVALGEPPAAHAALLAGLAACEAARALATGAGALEDGYLDLNLRDLRFERAPALRVPGCPACGG